MKKVLRSQPLSPDAKPSLAALQRSMAAVLMRPLSASDAMAPESAPTANALIAPNERLTSVERLQIYNQQYWWRLLGNFGDDFPGLRAVLGPRKFDKLAQAYLTQRGSTSWNLRDLGKHLARFLHENPALSDPNQRLAAEIAAVEWAQIEAFDGPQLPPVDPQKIARLAPGRLKLKLQPYLTLLELSHPVDTLLGQLKKRRNPGLTSNAVSPTQSASRPLRIKSKPAESPIFLAIHRVDFSVYFKRLEPEAYQLLKALQAGLPLADACELGFAGSEATPEETAQNVQAWFSTWMRLGWLC